MFFRKRIVPSTPPSLVTPYSKLASVMTALLQLDAHERPRAAGEIGPVVARGGHRGDGGGGVVRGGGDDRDAAAAALARRRRR